MFNELIEKIAVKSPVAVMARGLLENLLSHERINAIFQQHRRIQRESPWLFSWVVSLMSVVVCQIRPSVHAAFRKMKNSAPAGLSALYDKIDGIEPQVAEALVRETATHIKQILKHVPHHRSEIIPGYHSKIVDGNKIEATDRRLKVLREQNAAPLPGFALVVYEPVCRVISHAILCEDGHAQERSLFHRITPLVQADDLWFADRNFCCFHMLSGISKRGGFFVIRQHMSSIRWIPTSELEFCGASATGDVWEQKGVVELPKTKERLSIRRVEVRLKEPTRDGDTTLSLLCNLPETVSAILVADSYHGRWRIETAFQEMKVLLEGEINTLSYPRAALFALCVSYVSYNILQCLVSSIEATQPEASGTISPYYVADEVSSMFCGLEKLTDPSDWALFSELPPDRMGEVLLRFGRLTDFGEYIKRPPPKKKPVRKSTKRINHVSTHKLLKNDNPAR